MNEIFLVQAEYLDKVHGTMVVSPCACTFDYERAKEICRNVVEEDRREGQFPEDYNGWNEKYEDQFDYEDEMTKISIYVCSVDIWK